MTNLPVSDSGIQAARAVPIAEVWQRLAQEPVKEGRAFSSPFREDKNPSCQLGGPKNIFFDHATGESMDAIGLVRKVKGCGFSEAVQFIIGNGASPPLAAPGAPPRMNTRPASGNGGGHEKMKFWRDLPTALREFEKLIPAHRDEEALQFLWDSYGLACFEIPPDWRITVHKGHKGIVYRGIGPDGKVCSYKYRGLERDAKGKRLAFFMAGGGGALVFSSADPGAALVVVSGEEKGAAARVAGFRVWSELTGEGCLPDASIREILGYHDGDIVLANDGNDKHRTGEKANAETAAALLAAGCDPARIHVVQWPPDARKGYDLNDHLKAHGVEGLRALLAAAPAIPAIETPASAPDPKADKESGLGRLSIFSPTQILEAQLPADDCLLGDRILSRGECLLVPGPGGSGKSRLVAQLAADAVQGRPWAGVLETHCPNATWLFFQTENGMRRLQNDLSAMRRGMSGDAWVRFTDQVRFQVPLTDNDRFVSVGDAKTVLRLQAEVKAFDPDVIVFDPLIDFFSGESENDSLAMRETYQLLCRIARAGRPDAAWIIVHHSRTGKAAMRGSTGYDRAAFARGSKALYGAVRGALNLVPGSEDDPDLLLMIPAKNNNGKLPDPAAIRLDPWTMTYAPEPGFDWTAWANSLSDSRPRGGKRDAVLVALSVLGGQWTKYGDLERAIVAASGCSSRTARRYIKNAVSRGVVYEQDGLYSANGKKADTCPDT